MHLGVISDTHGLLRTEAVDALRGSEHIVHAGDIGSARILDALRELAPVTAVAGNNDRDAWSRCLPATVTLRIAGFSIHVIHDLSDLQLDPATGSVDAVICGHSHQPRVEHRSGVLFFNPGSAGPRRFRLPVTVGRIEMTGDALVAQIIALTTPH